MANPFFKALEVSQKASMGGNPMANFVGQFPRFLNEMRGKNPSQMIQDMLTSGQISQEQLNAVQQQAQQIMPLFEQFRGH